MLEKLIEALPDSTGQDRNDLAKEIAESNIDLTELFPILEMDSKLSMRFLWLVGDLAEHHPKYLKPYIIKLAELESVIEYPVFKSLPKLWFHCGVDDEEFSRAWDISHRVLKSLECSNNEKHRAIKLLYQLSKKDEVFKEEFLLCLDYIKDVDSVSIRKLIVELTES